MKTSLLTLALAAALPFAATAAEGLSYNYAEAGYVETDTRNGNADGWGLKGSVAISPNFHVFGDFARQTPDDTNWHDNQWRIGVGYNQPIASNTDLLARVAYNREDLKDSGEPSYNGYSAEVGVRSAFSDNFEAYALAGYEDYAKSQGINPEGEFYGRLGGQVKFNPNWGLTADIKFGKEGARQWMIGPRYSW